MEMAVILLSSNQFFVVEMSQSRISGTRTKYRKKYMHPTVWCKERNDKKNLSPKRNSFCILIDGSKLFTFVSPPETCLYYYISTSKRNYCVRNFVICLKTSSCPTSLKCCQYTNRLIRTHAR